MSPFALTPRTRLWAAAGFLTCLLSVLVVNAWQMAGLHDLAKAWQQAHARKDLAALEALYCWEGVEPSLRARLRQVFLQEFEIPIQSVTAEPCSKTDLLQTETHRPNLKPTGVIVVSFQSADGLGARLLAGGSWAHPQFVVLLPPPAE